MSDFNEYKDTEIGKIPKEWEVVELKKIGALQYGYTCSSLKENTGVKLLRITDIKDNGLVDWESVPYCEIDMNNYQRYKLDVGDILFARIGATTGKTAYVTEEIEGIFASYLIRFKPLIKDLSTKYFYYYTQSNIYWIQVNKRKEGQLKKGLNSKILANLIFPFPPLFEQQKIAEILSTVDKAIEKVNKGITKTERLKKGLLQELLTKGIGHIEFEDTEIGRIPKEWEVVRLEDIALEISRYPTYYNIQYVNEGIPEIRGELIKENGELEVDLTRYRYISNKTANNFPRTIVKKGDFVMSVRGTVGKIAIVSKLLDGAMITANLMRISLNTVKCYPDFYKQVFLSEKFQKKINSLSSSTTIKTIQAPRLKAIVFPLPPYPEQQKIAEILSTVDKRLKLLKDKKEKLRRIKKGLMNDLLTGKRRVKI